jgi:hypothetical protein
LGDSGIWVPPGGSADRPREPEPAPPQPQPEMPSPEELAAQLRQLKASDVVFSLIPTLAQVAWAKLDAQSRDLTEARVAIDAIRALVPVLDGVAPPDVTRDLQQLVTNLQLAFASAADESAPRQSDADRHGGHDEGEAVRDDERDVVTGDAVRGPEREADE